MTGYARPISCEEVRELLDDFLYERLGVEQRGRIRGHLLYCGECAAELAERVDRAIERNDLPRTPVPAFRAPKPRAAAIARGAIRGWLWRSRRAFARHEDEGWCREEEAFLQTEERLNQLSLRALEHWLDRATAPVPVSGGLSPAGSIQVRYLDEAWQPTGAVSDASIEQPLVITSEGEAHLVVSGEDTELEGRKLLCAVRLGEGEDALVLAAEIERAPDAPGWRAQFLADGLPAKDVAVSIPEEAIELYAVPSDESS